MATQSANMLTEAIAAIRVGDRHRARDLLSRLLRTDSANAEYWIWMSAVVDTPQERSYCLESALRLDSTNRAALRGMVILGRREATDAELSKALKPPRRKAPPSAVRPTPPPKSVAPVTQEQKPQKSVALRRGRRSRGGTFRTALLVVLLVAIGYGAYTVLSPLIRPLSYGLASTLPPPSPTHTDTPLPGTPTSTPIPAATRVVRTPITTDIAGTPLALLIPATGTPTPITGYTPHPSYGAYETGLNALDRGDYEQAVDYFDQVIELDPDLVDAYYFRGEAYRLNGDVVEAILSYDDATLMDPDYAPAFLGRGRVLFERDVNAALRDYERALEKDPTLTEAYLEIGKYYNDGSVWQGLELLMKEALDEGVRSPQLQIYLSNAQYFLEKYQDSLLSALEGSADDPALLTGYLAIGRAYVGLGIDELDPTYYTSAIWPLQTYVAYAPDDHVGWGFLSRALLGAGQLEPALETANLALELNDRFAPAYTSRGMIYTKMGLYEEAYEDMISAQRFGPMNHELLLETGRTLYYLGEYTDALSEYISPAIKEANEITVIVVKERKISEGYALRALIYETNPENIPDAIREWGWILGFDNVLPVTRALAERHYNELIGEGPTRTPTPSRTPTEPAPAATLTALAGTATAAP